MLDYLTAMMMTQTLTTLQNSLQVQLLQKQRRTILLEIYSVIT